VDGVSACGMIKSSKNINQHTPVIGITAYEKKEEWANLFDDVLWKPLKMEQLAKTLRSVTERKAL